MIGIVRMRAIACNLRTEGTDAEVFFVICNRMSTERVNTGETSNEKDICTQVLGRQESLLPRAAI